MTFIKARRKPIEVWAVRYNHSIILDEFIKMLSERIKDIFELIGLTQTDFVKKIIFQIKVKNNVNGC